MTAGIFAVAELFDAFTSHSSRLNRVKVFRQFGGMPGEPVNINVTLAPGASVGTIICVPLKKAIPLNTE